MLVSQNLAWLGGVARYAELESSGVSRQEVVDAARRGVIVRIRNGWFACAGAPTDVVKAVRVGGALTSGSVAKHFGLWTMPESRLHVRVASTASRLSSPHRAAPLQPHRDGVCVHYRQGTPRSAVDSLIEALAEMFRCADEVAAIVALGSALNSGLLRPSQLADLKALLLPSKRSSIDKVDCGSQSGLETIVRLLMRAHRVRFRTQVYIPGVGRVDMVLGDRLVLELDGKGFHAENFENDRQLVS